MRIRVLISIVLIAGWTLPACAITCPSEAGEAGAHSEAAADGACGHGDSADGHVASPGTQKAEPSAPAEAPTCCGDCTNPPGFVASAVDAKPRPSSSPAGLLGPVLPVFRTVALPSGAELRLREPPPLPYAQSRRPLLI